MATKKVENLFTEIANARRELNNLWVKLNMLSLEEQNEIGPYQEVSKLRWALKDAAESLKGYGTPTFDYLTELKRFEKFIGPFKALKKYGWDNEGWTIIDGQERKYYSFDKKVAVFFLEDGTMAVEAFGKTEAFEMNAFKKVEDFIDDQFKANGYEVK